MPGLGITQLSWGSGVALFPNCSATWSKTRCQSLTSKMRPMLMASLIRSACSASALLGYLDAQKVVWSWFCGISTSASRGWNSPGCFLLMPTCILQWHKSILLRFWSSDFYIIAYALKSSLQHDGVGRSIPQLEVTRQMFRQPHSRVFLV